MRILTTTTRSSLMLLTAVTSVLGRLSALTGPQRGTDDPERGDVPGWVMITLMSAVLVAALLAIAGPALEGLFNQAIDQVSP
ncbi:hypothetical protein E8P82_08995 [Arthrobacter echini]|uniref:Uncharacterized protein n=1 Tax=Arthrobacter echini TaxID=1529066 RepID=A0A4S5E427_9MICC|nr:hypothetical protein [Arthrobacter echini]THJ66142.1 hypothetical protein E8P82_08995 [Arthrobacter echini]